MKKYKKCQYCNEQIPIDSKRCPYCDEEIKEDFVEDENEKDSLKTEDENLEFKKKDIIKIATIALASFIIMLIILTLGFLCFKNKEWIYEKINNTSYIEKGIELYNKNDFENAKVYFNKQLTQSENAKAYYYLGKIYEKESNEYATIYNYSKALRMDSSLDDIKKPLAKLCIESYNKECIDEFIKLAYDFDSNDIQIAEAYAKKLLDDNENIEKVIQIANNIIKNNPNNEFAKYQLTKYYFEQNNINKAYEYSKGLSAEDIEMAKILAKILIKKDFYTDAIDTLNDAISDFGYDSELSNLRDEALGKKEEFLYKKEMEKYTKTQNQYSTNSNYKPTPTTSYSSNSQIDWSSYMSELERKIKNNWTPPKEDTSKRILVNFVIAKNGALLSSKVVKSSGNLYADRAAINAVEAAAPFRPLPAEFKGNSVPIEFTFDYNVLSK